MNEELCIGVERFLDKIGVLGLCPILDSQKCSKKGSCLKNLPYFFGFDLENVPYMDRKVFQSSFCKN